MSNTAIVPAARTEAIVAALFRRYTEQCNANNVGGDVAAQILGLSRARLSSLKRESQPENEKGPNPSASVFICLIKAIQRMENLQRAGHLPARSSRGDCQKEVLWMLQGGDPDQTSADSEGDTVEAEVE